MSATAEAEPLEARERGRSGWADAAAAVRSSLASEDGLSESRDLGVSVVRMEVFEWEEVTEKDCSNGFGSRSKALLGRGGGRTADGDDDGGGEWAAVEDGRGGDADSGRRRCWFCGLAAAAAAAAIMTVTLG